MSDPTAPPASDPASDPGERRLDRPPSDRYLAAEPVPGDAATTSSQAPARGVAFAVIAAIVDVVAITVAGGVLAVSAGLVVLAAAGGWAVAVALKVGAGDTIPRPRRTWIAAGLALAAVVLGQVGLWLFARTEGGVLPLVEYLGQTFGPLVPLQAIAATTVAYWSGR
jgi:hypothetical protein